MNSKPRKKNRIKKIDVVIVVVLLVIAGLVLTKAGFLTPFEEKIIENEDDSYEAPPEPVQPTPPESILPGYMRSVTTEDEGVHYDKLSISREWWYFTAVLDGKNSDLKDWAITVSFNHMARGDLLGTDKPDLLVVTLHGPNGDEYGGMINKERGLGLLQQPTLKAKTPGVSVTFEDSWAEGEAPEWHVHAEDNEIDTHHDIIIDLRYFAPSDPVWTYGSRALDISSSNLASYIFLSCNVTGTVIIDGNEYNVIGTGHHEHSWSPNVVTKGLINGWDWSHMTLDNGWNIYYSNYYPTPQFISSKSSKLNPYGSLLITTDQGDTITAIDNIDPTITATDERIFPFVKMPSTISISAEPGIQQPFLDTFDMKLSIDITAEDTYEKIWKFPTYVGMKVGRNTVVGTLTWSDNDGYHELKLKGTGTIWSMRALL